MGEFAGAVRFDGAPIDRATCDRLGRGVAGQPRAVLRQSGAAAIADRPAVRSATSAPADILELVSGAMLVADLRIDDREDLASALGMEAAAQSRDIALLGAACLQWGEAAATRLYGDFAYALWDERERRLTLARDAIGVRALYYSVDRDGVYFATTLRKMLSLPQVARDLDDMALADYMTQTRGDPERTFYRHIHRVPPGGIVTIDPQGARVTRYWTPDAIAPVRYGRDDDYVMAARELLDRAVASRIPARGTIATMLSGGFDSGAVASTAARLIGDRRIIAFTRVPGGPHPYADTLDEAAYARALAALYPNMDWAAIDEDVDLARDLTPEIEAPLLGQPRNGAFNPSWYRPLFDAAERADAHVLLNGGVGNMTLSWAGVPPYREALRHGRLISAGRIAFDTARAQQRTLGNVLRKDMIPLVEPRALRLWRWRRHDRGLPAQLRFNAVSADFLDTLDFQARARATGQQLTYEMSGDVRAWRMQTLHNQNARDSMASTRHFHSFERPDPMSDRRLAEFTLGIPDAQFFHQGQGRWLARRVLADRMPAATLAEQRTGRQCPEWHHIALRRRPAMEASLARIERSALAARVVDVPRLKALLDALPDDAETARHSAIEHNGMLQRGILMGSFLRWYEGGND